MNPFKLFLYPSSRRLVIASLMVLPISISVSAEVIVPEQLPAYTENQLQSVVPGSPNPYLAFLPDNVTPDYDYWDSVAYWKRVNNIGRSSYSRLVTDFYVEEESLNYDDRNDTKENAEQLSSQVDFGTSNASDRILIDGSFNSLEFVQSIVYENNGTIDSAIATNVVNGNITSVDSYIGDGLYGRRAIGSGDFDFYKTGEIATYSIIRATVTTLAGEDLIPYITLWNSSGKLIYAESSGVLLYQVEEEGQYFVCIGSRSGAGLSYPRDPFLESSGTGAATEGHYNMTMAVSDVDVYEMDFVAGDVFGFDNGSGPIQGMVMIQASNNKLRIGTQVNASEYYPDGHPLAMDGNVHGGVVIPATGSYYLYVAGVQTGNYQAELRVVRPAIESLGIGKQKIRVIFGGEFAVKDDKIYQKSLFFKPSIWGGPNLLKELTPTHSFLEAYGLDPKMVDPDNAGFVPDYEILTNRIIEVLQNQLPDVEFEIANSFSDDPGLSQLLIMGNTWEVGINTIGIAESIDVGNDNVNEDAIILHDYLVSVLPEWPVFIPGPLEGNTDYEKSRRLDLIARTIGNIAAHEAGHILGCFHTNRFNSVTSIMDRGGDLGTIAPIGPDRIFNTFDDDQDIIAFSEDQYSPVEFYIGFEDTYAVVEWGSGGGANLFSDLDNLFVNYNLPINGIGTESNPFNKTNDAVSIINPGGTINIAPGSGSEVFTGGDTIDTPMTLKKTDAVGVVRIGE